MFDEYDVQLKSETNVESPPDGAQSQSLRTLQIEVEVSSIVSTLFEHQGICFQPETVAVFF